MNIPLNIDWQQILLHMFNFAVLVAVLYFVLYKPVKNFMNKRENLYKEMDEKAKQNIEQSEKIKDEYKQKLESVDNEINAKKKQADEDIAKMKAEAVAKADKEALNIVEKAKDTAQREHDNIINRANSEICNMVSSAAQKLVFKDTSDAYEKFLSDVEGEINE